MRQGIQTKDLYTSALFPKHLYHVTFFKDLFLSLMVCYQPYCGCMVQPLVVSDRHTSNDSPTLGGKETEEHEIQVIPCERQNKTSKSAKYPAEDEKTEEEIVKCYVCGKWRH